jgi:hypothetical protein
VFGRINSLIRDFVSLFAGFISLFGGVGKWHSGFLRYQILMVNTSVPAQAGIGFFAVPSRDQGTLSRPYRAPIGAPGSARSALCTRSNEVTTPRSSAVLAIGSQVKTSPTGSSPWHMKVDTPARLINPG